MNWFHLLCQILFFENAYGKMGSPTDNGDPSEDRKALSTLIKIPPNTAIAAEPHSLRSTFKPANFETKGVKATVSLEQAQELLVTWAVRSTESNGTKWEVDCLRCCLLERNTTHAWSVSSVLISASVFYQVSAHETEGQSHNKFLCLILQTRAKILWACGRWILSQQIYWFIAQIQI